MLANNWSPPRLRLLALETMEPAEDHKMVNINEVQIYRTRSLGKIPFGSCVRGARTLVTIHDEMNINDGIRIKWRK